MMVLATSALLAILLDEPDAPAIAEAVADDPRRLASAFTALETSLVIEEKKGEEGGRGFDLLAVRTGRHVVAMDAGQVELAGSAWRRYGKGRHPAGPNIGDCCSYGLSRLTGNPCSSRATSSPGPTGPGGATPRSAVPRPP